MNQEIINLFDEYTHKPLSREDFIKRLVKLTGSTVAALTVLPLLEVNYANATTIQESDEDLVTSEVTYEGEGTMVKAYLAQPKEIKGEIGAVLVIHENRGLNPYIEDVARRLAVAGFLALAPDALSPLGGYPGSDDKGREMQSKRKPDEMLEDFIAGAESLKKHELSTGKV
ncbi:MAG: dienelactone hydrolase family protein, partial [Spirosomataceae bacterium]